MEIQARAARVALGGAKTIVIPHGASPKNDSRFMEVDVPRTKPTMPVCCPRPISLPSWATQSVSPDAIGLRFEEMEMPGSLEFPAFITFPLRLAKVRVGGFGGNEDIALSAWEDPNHRCLYSPHVIFEYLPSPSSFWTIRSTHGHRSGRRQTAVDGKLLNAADGPKPIRTGSRLKIGIFSFSFQDNTLRNHSWFENPKDMVEQIERKLRHLVEDVPQDRLPDKVRSELSPQGKVSWDDAYVRHYHKVFRHLWGSGIISWLDSEFKSKGEVDRDLGALNRIRNVVFHPSRSPLNDRDRERLAGLFLRFVNGISVTGLAKTNIPIS